MSCPCVHCGEPVEDPTQAMHFGFRLTPQGEREPEISAARLHVECGIRILAGSAAHQLKECSCYGGTREDPPGVTVREAARLAYETFLLLGSLQAGRASEVRQ